MTSERQSWLSELEPPPGGSERLHQRLKAADHPVTSHRWWIGAACTAVTVAAAIIVLLRIGDGRESEATMELRQAESLDRLLGRPMEPTETSLSIDDEAVQISRLDGTNPKIHIYRID